MTGGPKGTYSFDPIRSRHPRATPKSRPKPLPKRRQAGGAIAAGTGSPRKIFALERWIAHAITAYQRRISSDGSSPAPSARRLANFLVKEIVSFAHRPWRSKLSATKSNGTWRRKRASEQSSPGMSDRKAIEFLHCNSLLSGVPVALFLLPPPL